MKKDIYKIKNSIQKLNSGNETLFLDLSEYNMIKKEIKNYNVFYPNKSSEKVILYNDKLPNVSLYKISSINKLRHQDILGSILSLNISSSYLGDIIIDNNNYYFYILSSLDDFIENNLNKIGKFNVTIEKIPLDVLSNYERKYEELTTIVTSLRIDNVISKIIGVNRKKILSKINNKEVILNNNILIKNTYVLKENDIFSIRGYGKYKYIGIINNTKKDNYVIRVLKYV